MSQYVFEGVIIKLNKKHFDAWKEVYTALDLSAELNQMDMEFQIREMENGKPLKNWFSECFRRLNSRNIRSANERRPRPNGAGNNKYKSGHAETTRAQAERALQRIDSQVGNPNLYTDG